MFQFHFKLQLKIIHFCTYFLYFYQKHSLIISDLSHYLKCYICILAVEYRTCGFKSTTYFFKYFYDKYLINGIIYLQVYIYYVARYLGTSRSSSIYFLSCNYDNNLLINTHIWTDVSITFVVLY